MRFNFIERDPIIIFFINLVLKYMYSIFNYFQLIKTSLVFYIPF